MLSGDIRFILSGS